MKKNLYSILFALLCASGFSQTAQIKGVVLNDQDFPIKNVMVQAQNKQVYTNTNGFYYMDVEAGNDITIQFQAENYLPVTYIESVAANQSFELNIRLSPAAEELKELVIDSNLRKRFEGTTVISPDVIRKIPGANAGVENITKLLPGVYSNNELSTGYNVRGGNFDENMVYVNEIEVYRPFLVRSGQQEGLSFTNTSMTDKVDFSSGGFQSKYGDKMSSVLDITYRKPSQFGGSFDASILGGGLTVDLASKNKKWTAITGVRYRNNALLVKSQDVDVDFTPRFLDVQSLITFQPTAKWEWSLLLNASSNVYEYTPLFKRTKFGTIQDAKELQVRYQGGEIDRYQTYFGALKGVFKPNLQNSYTLIASAYHTKEEEYYDIWGSYALGNVSGDLGGNAGEVEYTVGLGSQLNHGRNNYDAFIVSTEMKGQHKLDETEIEWGVRYVSEDIRDRLLEWEVIDSAGFSLANPYFSTPNNQPYEPYQGELVPFQNVRATNFVTINRLNGFAQWNKRGAIGKHETFLNFGVRAHYWNVAAEGYETAKGQITVSPRAQFAIKPDWETDMVFRLSGGLYHQPPSYRELRAMDGSIRPNVKAQQSIHVVLSNDYSFKIKSTPFKLFTELYYKDLSNVNTYTLENVRIRYRADNNAKAYVYGADVRINGEIVPGIESWFSVGYLKTEENYNNRGFIARPTDQRLKLGLMFQDYMPAIPNLKLYLNQVYNTPLPGGSPSYVDPYDYQLRLKNYMRSDAGFSYIFKDQTFNSNKKWLQPFKEVAVGFEIYNLFNNENAITNTWVRDVYSKVMYAIPNRMTMRTFNLKLNMSW
ncbi:TonB-dependent receptor plug domain-containing protein [Flavobacterium sp. CBA20B-1]|uniref:TonB-dependent receptor n=1 Tax=unclassified Flavobacterium TaxID=196869 RepID=UPI0022241D42|nr:MULTISPECIES: TonB-dependent receptor plug domain-containing protein [unclassified Flavobacterium]WCM42058.1 TonB-dependent receptor plug domain-containing protein [Flavobacterium sp. CBA20B-1]